jgi:hypothetical protein
MSPFFAGLLFGLVLTLPIRAPKPLCDRPWAAVGFPCALIGVLIVCLCDSFFIVLGGSGLRRSGASCRAGLPGVLIAIGSVCLIILGLRASGGPVIEASAWP